MATLPFFFQKEKLHGVRKCPHNMLKNQNKPTKENGNKKQNKHRMLLQHRQLVETQPCSTENPRM